MKLESVKSFTLTLLVAISLLLTFGLWTYQPSNEILEDQNFQPSIDVGGSELKKQDLISPETVLFHANGGHYGYSDPSYRENLYKDMHSWTLTNLQATEETDQPDNNNRVMEIIFPESLPMQLLPTIFDMNDSDSGELPIRSFNQIDITFNREQKILNLHFISESGREQAIATVNDSSKYDKMWKQITEKEHLSKLIAYDKGEQQIYIPLNNKTLLKRDITVVPIEENKMVKALFPESSLVSKSGNYYNDDRRDMRVENNGKSIAFTNPTNANSIQINVQELLDQSVKSINDHKGWTDDYKLVHIDQQSNLIRYRMYYDGYPTYSSSDLTIIEQKWKNANLFKYNRSLINLKEVINDKEVTLPSGSELIAYLENEFSKAYDLDQIKDIKIGYQFISNNNSSLSVTLEPAWFVNLNDMWLPIDFEELEPEKGGAIDAVDAN
ncbi:hypothetical protein CFK37_06315 [Virgibacillus phasianinus]|uniref:Regulatory protein YycH domain-containing protein n=1 Tax=Virgibacillus phasianinus TaxID=2017483 RepID=A0A220U111_9BACI|nr:two-component system activity regulator YycH [Virgibacillus phasianinus]ASK61797.1 hypothetical protein CFK37_06315 [Virgibacillus phasianinus]